MLKVQVKGNTLVFGDGLSLTFLRTLRIPDDGKTYPLPPGLASFPILQVEDYAKTVPQEWVKHGGVFIPMYQHEAMWISFHARQWKPNAMKIAIGKVNAVSGKAWDEKLSKDKEDYIVCPPQPWLDGINAGDGFIKQFVAMPLGMGYTVEAQVTGKEDVGGVQIIVYEPKAGKFPDEPPKSPVSASVEAPDFDKMSPSEIMMWMESLAKRQGASQGFTTIADMDVVEMGLGAGGRMKQKIYPDPHGIDTWDADNYGRVFVHIVNSMAFREITGKEPPTTPVSAKTYAQYKLPWFDLYDDKMGDIDAPDELKSVKSVKEMDAEKGFKPQQDDSSVDLSDSPTIKYKLDKDDVNDGEW